ncbi:hypothetical protein CLV30_12583 [Haloactinopolyspora alba]|uniref:Tail assembly chaperone n=1 Tax=Haloactinopolyspora alba TaxID=648780 RepID=A0A2P8DHL1_9ACTN|nr:hypothetical protein [Haloactinopolyspora alba]PSK96701.1 hypothetical protein CLV30_12583 [Haloactinopolyspora alba]
MSDAESILAKLNVSLAEVTVPLYLNGRLYADWQDAQRELTDRQQQHRASADSLAGDPEARRLAKRVDELEEQVRQSRAIVRLRSLGRAWTGYVVKHPPRDGDEDDKAFGANRDAVFDEVMPLSMIEVTTADGQSCRMAAEVDGELTQTEPELYRAIVDAVNDEQWSNLCNNVYALNRGGLSVPFSHVASKINQSSGGDSSKPNGSGSRTSGSRGGSRGKSSSTSTTSKDD